MSGVQYYNADQVRNVLSWSLINEAVEASFKAVSKNDKTINDDNAIDSYANQPPRTITKCGINGNELLLTMPAFVGNYEMSINGNVTTRNTLACKLVTSFPENVKRIPPMPTILAHILVFNANTGQLESIVEGTQITAWRTASASIVATKYLYFKHNEGNGSNKAINVAIIGCGVQGTSHAIGMCATFNVSNIYLWNRTVSKAEILANTLRSQYPNINVFVKTDSSLAVADADVICIGTYSPTALISFDMIKKHDVHINTVGAGQIHFGEVAQDIYDNAAVYVDSWENAKVELKDLKANIIAEVGEIIRNDKRSNKNGLTLFQSMGMAAEDATVAHAVVEAIKATKINS